MNFYEKDFIVCLILYQEKYDTTMTERAQTYNKSARENNRPLSLQLMKSDASYGKYGQSSELTAARCEYTDTALTINGKNANI